MSSTNIVDLCSDGEFGEVDVKAVKLELVLARVTMQQKEYQKANLPRHQKSNTNSKRQESEENRSLNCSSTRQNNPSILDQQLSPIDDTSLLSASPICSAPVCRQFWKAGNYDEGLASKSTLQNDGGGMDPEAMRRCLSFGFSDKKSKSAIGQYGNGFKTSSMRLGADVIVFSRHFKERKLTQSIGLLSYTFLSQTGHDRIVVPVWSPYSTEAELLKQFDDISYHGTKVIVYNLWLNDEGTMELDFDSDPEDIRISGDVNPTGKNIASDQHLANRLRYSLRVYLSILYLRLPESFCMILRGRVVEYHNIATDLKFPEFILYKPQSGGWYSYHNNRVCVKEAPHVNIHGFNVYHKNRLILPFWHVVSFSDSRGRGVVGVLEANFIEPTHNKQDFEKTSVFQKLEHRLKEMTWEYWDYHCGLIGYQVKKKIRAPTASPLSADGGPHDSIHPPLVLNKSSLGVDTTIERRFGQAFSNIQRRAQLGEQLKRKEQHPLVEPENIKRRAGGVNLTDTAPNQEKQPSHTNVKQFEDQEAINLLQENKRLREQCLEYEKVKEELNLKVTILRTGNRRHGAFAKLWLHTPGKTKSVQNAHVLLQRSWQSEFVLLVSDCINSLEAWSSAVHEQ
ncbi:histidine kinase-, DNA gyrase B-, and HSP90-like ATPase family protein [Actinidia rufa]|uniref:Histidine kinase-, DNA gyrase B-, and HSP90-like ATPase family protein n=1 Tax=Actinidia rufa TaxID=165716 RepID=A0A7J0H348_9ERIC|nr:histidine kinase-, DNA gyrase B-, and HSP90-like ATPase family protein [Actinidia rufa]